MPTRRFTRSLSLSWLSAALAGALILGGCPRAQTPGTPSNQDDADTTTDTGGSTTPDIDRPVPPVDTDTQTTTSGGGTTTDGTSGGDSTSGGGSSAPVAVIVSSPTQDTFVRPGAVISITYELVDSSGAVASAEVVVARDDNQDRTADGDPILTQPIATLSTGSKTASLDTVDLVPSLANGFGRFLLGVRATLKDSTDVELAYGQGILTVDTTPPTALWLSPQTDELLSNSANKVIQVRTTDNSPHDVTVQLDTDQNPDNGFAADFGGTRTFSAGTDDHNFTQSLASIAPGTYFYYVTVTDHIDPDESFYASSGGGAVLKLIVTSRLVGDFYLENLPDSGQGAIFQGVNFNDLAGSSMSEVPSLDGDGRSELLVVSRFGKPYNAFAPTTGVGFGEAYLFYGSGQRLSGTKPLNSAGASVPGLIFPGIRTPRNVNESNFDSTGWTEGMADVTVIDDMDGDDLPEIVFSFPRVESITLGDTDPLVQLPELVPDLTGMGNLEYSAYSGGGDWSPGLSQFTRGGVVIVSSHNTILQNANELNRRANRVVDLHEVGQIFSSMFRPGLVRFIRDIFPINDLTDPFNLYPPHDNGLSDCLDCDLLEDTKGCDPMDPNLPVETDVVAWFIFWDVIFNNQGPGGFLRENTFIPVSPPLANPSGWPFNPPFPYSDIVPEDGYCPLDVEGTGSQIEQTCHIINFWWVSGNCMAGIPFPGGDGSTCAQESWMVPGLVPTSIWTGFYGPNSTPLAIYNNGQAYPAPVGARVMGQAVDDRFGTSLGSDGTWLYIAAPERTANQAPYSDDVDGLASPRADSGVVYQLRTDSRETPTSPTRTQLWIEPNRTWPQVDADPGMESRTDYTIPAPHNYIIESVGSLRGFDNSIDVTFIDDDECPPSYIPSPSEGTLDYNVNNFIQPQPVPTAFLYPVGTAGDYVDRTQQIVGPHASAKISVVRGLGDMNGDGIRDFAVGSPNIKSDVVNGTGDTVGAVFFVYGRPTGVEGNYLLEKLALDPADPGRLAGVLIRGDAAGSFAGAFGDAGDVNGDGYADVIVGNQSADNSTGEVVVILGSPFLISGLGGWTVDQVPAGSAIHFVGASVGELAGANVSSAGDVDGDGFTDLLIAAPGYNSNRGAVYLVYGSPSLASAAQPISLGNIGTASLPGVRFIGRKANDFAGGGTKSVSGTHPTNNNPISVTSRGVVPLGDVDGDGADDFAISAMLADPNSKQDAGEVYVIYGKRGN